MENYFTIGETAKRLGVTTRTLRNWEKNNIFLADHMEKGMRMYSESSIEEKVGFKINIEDVVLKLSKSQITDLVVSVPKGIFKGSFDFSGHGDTIKEKYESLQFLINRLSLAMHRENEKHAANFILSGPEIASIFITATSNFYPSSPKEFSDKNNNLTLFQGTLGSKRIYASMGIDPNEIILGVYLNGKILKSKGCLARITMLNYVSTNPWEGI